MSIKQIYALPKDMQVLTTIDIAIYQIRLFLNANKRNLLCTT